MNIIFVTLSNITSIKNRGIYPDLMRKFRDEGHQVVIVSPCDRRMKQPTHVIETEGVHILKVRTLNIQKTNIVEKGIGTLLIESQYKRAIKKYFGDVQFDLILYSTPPITFTNVVRYLKKQNPKAVSYLLLKDIFPQNAVDIGMFSEGSLFNRYFRRKEVALYKTSDYIGCMSPANVEFILAHNDFLDKGRVEVAPNSIELSTTNLTNDTNDSSNSSNSSSTIRKKYGLPTDVPVFIYGGNLGKPQGIDFLIRCLEQNKHRTDCHFVVIGNGTEYHKLDNWYKENQKTTNYTNSTNIEKGNDNQCSLSVTVMERLPKEDYDVLVQSCDVGLIFLDHRFTIPNYPSRLLSYLEYKMPVLCATDPNTDIGRIAEENGFGLWCESKLPSAFTNLVNKFLTHPKRMKEMGERGYEFLKKNYLVQNTYDAIMQHL